MVATIALGFINTMAFPVTPLLSRISPSYKFANVQSSIGNSNWRDYLPSQHESSLMFFCIVMSLGLLT